ncbi:MAG TPA: hypothetical protein VEU72_10125 [Nitrosopumilaceae archaeon]|nr:hypothetical protein [Nitrosopumilaceae archaeon]
MTLTNTTSSAVTELVPSAATGLTSGLTQTLSNTTSSAVTSIVGNLTSKINNVTQLPQIIIAEKSNVTAVNAAIISQSSVLLNKSFAPLASGITIVNAIGLPNYTLPNSTSVVAVIPTVVTTVNQTSGQFVATPPLSKIIPGQEMIIPVADSLIPSFGGLKEIHVQSSPTANSTGGIAPSEWFVAEVDNKIPSSINASAISDTPILFLSVQYPFEQTGIGFNWGNPQNHAKPPTLTLVVNKTNSDFIQNDSAGCPMIDAYTLSLGSWTSNGLGEISSTSISPTQCQVTIQSQHLSKFVFSMRHISTIKNTDTGGFGIGTVVRNIPGIAVAEATNGNGTVANNFVQTTSTKTVGASTKTGTSQGFSNISCSKGTEYAFMTGQYYSGSVSYKAIFVKMILLDSTGHILATGNGVISDVNAQTTTSFDAIARYDGSFASCQAQIDSSIKK